MRKLFLALLLFSSVAFAQDSTQTAKRIYGNNTPPSSCTYSATADPAVTYLGVGYLCGVDNTYHAFNSGGSSGWPVTTSVHVQSGGTITVDSGGTLTYASGSTFPGSSSGTKFTSLYVDQIISSLAPSLAGTLGSCTLSSAGTVNFCGSSTLGGFGISNNGGAFLPVPVNPATTVVGNVPKFGDVVGLTFLDSGLAFGNLVTASSPGVGLCHFAGSTQACTSSAVNLNSADVTGLTPIANGGTGSSTQAAAFAAIGIPLALGAITWNNAGNCTFAAANAPIAGGTITTVSSQTCTLIPTGLVTWGSYTIKIANAASTAATLTLGTSGASCSAWKVGGGGSGAITLSGASAIDSIAFTFDGTNCLANFRANFN